MMRTNMKRRGSMLLALFLSLALLVGAIVTLEVAESFAASPSPAEAVREAWQKARDTGYGFEAGVEQTLIPRPVWSQLGRQEEQVSFYLEGEVEQPGHSRVRVWPETGPPNAVAAGTLGQINPAAVEPLMEIIQEGTKTIIREHGQERVAESPASLAAPGGDYLAYLEAARDVEQMADCRLASGTCFRFRIDGPRFAEVLRKRLEQEYAADLPPNVQLAPSPLFQAMTGQGELWVDADGFPVRQVLDLDFPRVSEEYGARAHVVADFTPDKETRGQGDKETVSLSPCLPLSLSPSLLATLSALLFACGLVLYRRCKPVYVAIVTAVILSMVGSPLYTAWRMDRFFRMHRVEAAGPSPDQPPPQGVRPPAEPTDEPLSPALQAFIEELQEAAKPNSALPGYAIGERLPMRDPRLAGIHELAGPPGVKALAEPPPDGCYEGDEDSDTDGLCDQYEVLLGTDDTHPDTDRDQITDTLEIQGFTYADRQWYTNPFLGDSNQDGLGDFAEWPEPVGEAPSWDPDNDGLPNVWDDDNDGDGVVDSLDLSPWSYSPEVPDNGHYALDVDAGGHDGPVYLEFQVQPSDHKHLRYAMKTLDWPWDDKGQITDLDNSPDDLTLIPMLEVLASHRPRDAKQYSIGYVKNQDSATKGTYPWKLYVPTTVDDAEGSPAAFHAKAVFQGIQTIRTKAALVWMVNAKLDSITCAQTRKVEHVPEPVCVWWDFKTEESVVQTYRDKFRVSGEGGTDLAVVGTPQREDNGDLVKILLGLSQTYLLGKWNDLGELKSRFDSSDNEKRWSVTTSVTVARDTYSHMDEAIASTTMTTTRQILADYNTAWTPAMLVAFEEKVRIWSLDDVVANSGPQTSSASASLSLGSVPMLVQRGLKLSQYRHTGSDWATMDINEMLADLDARYKALASVDLMQMMKLLWTAWSQGLMRTVQVGAHRITYKNVLPDNEIYKDFKGLPGQVKDVVEKVVEAKKTLKEFKEGYDKVSKFIKDHPRWSVAIASAAAITFIILSLAYKGVSKAASIIGAAIGVGLAIYGVYKAYQEAKGVWALVKGAAKITKLTVVLAIVALVLEVVLIWYAFYSAAADLSGPAYYMALSLAIGATILAVILFILCFFLIGLVIMAIIAIADFIGSFFGFSVSGWIAKVIGELILTVKVLTNIDGDSIKFDVKETTWQNLAAGSVPGNKMILRAELRGDLVAENDGTDDDLRRSTLKGSWQPSAADPAQISTDSATWKPAGEPSGGRRTVKNRTEAYLTPRQPAIDAPADLAVKVDYTILYKKGHGCVAGHCAWWEGASKDSGDTTSDPSRMYLDVLPATLDAHWKNDQWEDGLWEWSAIRNYDRDGDGVPNSAEAALGTSPDNPDSDGDGIDDGAEARLRREGKGVDPAKYDTDNDGLSDGAERAGYMMDFRGFFVNRWAFPDPRKADADGDGLTDGQEYALKTNPNAGVTDLNAWIYSEPTGGPYLPGVPVTITVQAINFTTKKVAPWITARLPGSIKNQWVTLEGTTGDGRYKWSWTKIDEPDGTNRWIVRAIHPLGTTDALTITLTGHVDPNLSQTTVMTFTSSLTYTKSLTETYEVIDMNSFVVDVDPPTSTIMAPAEGAILRGETYVAGGKATDPTSDIGQVHVSDDGGSTWNLAAGTEAWNWVWELPDDGDYTLRSRATDALGWMEDPVTSLVNVTVDNTSPTTPIGSLVQPAGAISPGSLVRLTSTEGSWVITATGQARDDLSGAPKVAGVSTVDVRADDRPPDTITLTSPGQPISDWQAMMKLPPSRPEGHHWVTASAIDGVGNVQPEATAVEFAVDNTPPAVQDLYALAVITSTTSEPVRIVPDESGAYRPLPVHQPLRGSVDARSGRVGYRALAADDLSGGHLASGDFNGDDLADLAIGAPAAAGTAGIVYLIFGKPGPWLPRHNLEEADAWLVGPAAGARAGQSLANGGDLNGDGIDDLLIGSADGAYVVPGREAAWIRREPLDADARLLPGQATLVAGGGDLDGNGTNDGVVAAGDTLYLVPGGAGRPKVGPPLGTLPDTVDSLAGHANAGVIAGSSDGNEAWLWMPVGTSTPLPRSPSAIIRAASGSKTPSSVGYAGDVNGDGLPDWLIGDGRTGTARVVRLFCGRTWTGAVYHDVDDATAGFSYGTAGEPALLATGIGDVNADGYSDLIVGFGSTAWVMHGRSDPEAWGLEYDLANADATVSYLKAATGGDLNCDSSSDVAFLTDDGRLSLFFGREGDSCALTPAGVSGVEIGLGEVTDPTSPLTATLPTQWLSAQQLGTTWERLPNIPSDCDMYSGSRIVAAAGRIWAIVQSSSFYVYDPQTGTWTQRTFPPASLGVAGLLAAGSDGYLYTVGDGHTYRYDPTTDAWTQLGAAPVSTGQGANMVPDDAGHLYVLGGASYSKEFWRYDIASDFWERVAYNPVSDAAETTIEWGGDGVYAFPRLYTRSFYRYDPDTNQWTALADTPDELGGYGSALAWDGGQYIYAVRGGYEQRQFYQYDKVGRDWERLGDTPGDAGTGSALAWLDGLLYFAGDMFGRDLCQWTPSTMTIRPQVVDQLGNVGYGEERTISVSTPDLGNIIENYASGDISTQAIPLPNGTAVASQGIQWLSLHHVRLEGDMDMTHFAYPAGNPTCYHWAFDRDFPTWPNAWPDGTHNVTASVKDTTGAEHVSDPLTIIVDTTPPTAGFTSPTNGTVITATGRITITGTASDATSGLARVRFSPDNGASWREVSLDGNTWLATWDVPAGLDGVARHLVVEAADRGGLTTRQTIAVTVDNVLPSGFTPVTFSPEEGNHTFTGVQFEATWPEPSDGSGIAGVYAALDPITDTLPTQQVTGNTFQTDFPAEGTYFFHLLVVDNADNRVVRHYGPWYVEVPGLPPVSSIIVDGVLDIENYEWLPETERLGQDDRSGEPQELFISWDDDQVFLGWQGADPGVDGDLIWYFDTGSGGTNEGLAPQAQALMVRKAQPVTLWDLEFERMGAVQWTLPFEADAYFIFRGDGSFGLFRWDGSAWQEVTDERVQAVHGPENDTEAVIPFDLLSVSGAVQMLALARRLADGPVWAVLPDTNPLAGPWPDAYSWPGWTWDVIPNEGQPDAWLTWLRLDSPQPSGLYLPVGGTITHNLAAGNAATYAADEAWLTLAGEGLVFETFSGQGTCTDCPPGGDAWTVDLGTIPARGQVAITVTARTLDTGGATVPVTTTVHLTAGLPDAEPEDNVRSLSHLVDGTPPTATVVEPRDGGTIQSGPQEVIGVAQAGRGAAVALVEFSTDGVSWQPTEGTVVWMAEVDVPAQETLTFYVRATDEAGNVGPVTTATFTADDVAPVPTITPPEGAVGGEEYELAGTAYDPFPEGGELQDVEVRVDDEPWTPVDSLLGADDGYAWRFDWSLPEGEEGIVHTVQARATDAAGNVGESAPVEIIVDTMGPRSEIVSPADETWLESGTTQIIVWGWSEDGSGVEQVRVSLDGGLTWAEAVVADEAKAMLAEQPETRNPKQPHSGPSPARCLRVRWSTTSGPVVWT